MEYGPEITVCVLLDTKLALALSRLAYERGRAVSKSTAKIEVHGYIPEGMNLD